MRDAGLQAHSPAQRHFEFLAVFVFDGFTYLVGAARRALDTAPTERGLARSTYRWDLLLRWTSTVGTLAHFFLLIFT